MADTPTSGPPRRSAERDIKFFQCFCTCAGREMSRDPWKGLPHTAAHPCWRYAFFSLDALPHRNRSHESFPANRDYSRSMMDGRTRIRGRTGGTSKVRRRGKALNAVMLPCALALALATAIVNGAQAQPNVEELWCASAKGVAEVDRCARRSLSVSETSTVHSCRNNSTMGFARTVESELRVEADSGQTLGEPSCANI